MKGKIYIDAVRLQEIKARMDVLKNLVLDQATAKKLSNTDLLSYSIELKTMNAMLGDFDVFAEVESKSKYSLFNYLLKKNNCKVIRVAK